MTFRYMLCVCAFFKGEEMFTPAQLQAEEPSLSAVWDVFSIVLVAAQFLVDISYIVRLKRRTYMLTRDSLIANGYA
jgi:hypothetical protein